LWTGVILALLKYCILAMALALAMVRMIARVAVEKGKFEICLRSRRIFLFVVPFASVRLNIHESTFHHRFMSTEGGASSLYYFESSKLSFKKHKLYYTVVGSAIIAIIISTFAVSQGES
jgi:hypothetical protein